MAVDRPDAGRRERSTLDQGADDVAAAAAHATHPGDDPRRPAVPDLAAFDPTTFSWDELGTTEIVLLVVAAILLIALVVAIVVAVRRARRRAQRRERLKKAFGPEYERTVSDLGRSRGERDLAERLERHGGFERRYLDAAAVTGYHDQLEDLQARFVDGPIPVVRDANALVREVALAVGYPDGSEARILSDVSVEHPTEVAAHRRGQEASRGDGRDEPSTEDMRAALLASRDLLDAMLAPSVRRLAEQGAAPERRELRRSGHLASLLEEDEDRDRHEAPAPRDGRAEDAAPGGHDERDQHEAAEAAGQPERARGRAERHPAEPTGSSAGSAGSSEALAPPASSDPDRDEPSTRPAAEFPPPPAAPDEPAALDETEQVIELPDHEHATTSSRQRRATDGASDGAPQTADGARDPDGEPRR
jgi:hypothetical protein